MHYLLNIHLNLQALLHNMQGRAGQCEWLHPANVPLITVHRSLDRCLFDIWPMCMCDMRNVARKGLGISARVHICFSTLSCNIIDKLYCCGHKLEALEQRHTRFFVKVPITTLRCSWCRPVDTMALAASLLSKWARLWLHARLAVWRLLLARFAVGPGPHCVT